MLLAKEYPRYGFRKMFNKLKLLGYKWNHKKVYRAYCQLKLALRNVHEITPAFPIL